MSISTRLSRQRRIALAASATGLGLTLVGCSASEQPEESQDTGSAQPTVAGGTVTIGSYLDPSCLDPAQNGALVSLLITKQIVDTLTDIDPETGEVVPWLATDWEISDDYTEYTFSLRDGVTFSDGTPLNAEAVIGSFQGILDNPETTIMGTPLVANVESMEAVDDLTVAFTMSQASPGFLTDTANTALGIISPASYEGLTADERCAQGVVGSGPYVVDSYETNDAAQLSKRDDYAWGSSLWENTGAGYVDAVTVQFLPESSVRSGALQSGQVDMIFGVPEQSAALFDGNGYALVSQANPGVAVSLNFNLASEVGSDAAVRQAIALGINRDDMALVYGAEGAPTAGFLSPTTPGAGDFSSEITTDQEAAATLLDDAGWLMGADGIREKDGAPLVLDVPYFFDGPVVELMQQQLADIGVRLELSQVEIAEYLELLSAGEFDATVGNLTRASVTALAAIYSSAEPNWYGQSDEELDAALAAITATADAAEQAAASDEAQQIMFDNAYAVPMHSLAQAYAMRDGVQGFVFDATAKPILHELSLTDQ